MAEFVSGLNAAAAADPKLAASLQESIAWAAAYSPFTPVTLTPDGNGQLIPSVTLAAVNSNPVSGESRLRQQGEPDIDLAALSALADEYLIDNRGAMKAMLEHYARGGLELVRQKLEESGVGESARNLRAARRRCGLE